MGRTSYVPEAKRLLLVDGDVRGHGPIGLGVLLPEAHHLLLGRRSHRDNAAKGEETGGEGTWATFRPRQHREPLQPHTARAPEPLPGD